MLNKLKGQHSIFLLVSILISGLGFLRSLILAKNIDTYQLGLISIIQSIILLSTFFQIGIVSGAYRLLIVSEKLLPNLNKLIFTFSTILFVILVLFFYLYTKVFALEIEYYYIIYAILIGIASILCNWFNNVLIAGGRLKLLNSLNLLTNTLPFLLYPFLTKNFVCSILFIASQPLLFVIAFLYIEKIKLAFFFNKRYFTYMLYTGFVPFLLVILHFFYGIVEKWLIGFTLGYGNLGKYFLVNIFSTIFFMLPSALNGLLFPEIIRANRKNSLISFIVNFKNYYYFLIIYSVSTYLFLIFFAPYVTAIFLPRHLNSIDLIHKIFYGSVLYLCIQPIIMMYNARLKYLQLIISYSLAYFVAFVSYLIFLYFNKLSLSSFAITNSLFFGSISVFIIINLFTEYRKENLFES